MTSRQKASGIYGFVTQVVSETFLTLLKIIVILMVIWGISERVQNALAADGTQSPVSPSALASATA